MGSSSSKDKNIENKMTKENSMISKNENVENKMTKENSIISKNKNVENKMIKEKSLLINEINELRKKPKEYIKKLIKNKQYFKNGTKIWRYPDKVQIKTEEGPAAYDEAIDFLKNKAVAVKELTPSKGLNNIALDFLKEFQRDENSNIEMEPIIYNHGDFSGDFRRLVKFGYNTPEHIVVNLVVSDGDKSRGQRNALLSDKLNRIGVAQGKHDLYGECCIIVACTIFENNNNDKNIL